MALKVQRQREAEGKPPVEENQEEEAPAEEPLAEDEPPAEEEAVPAEDDGEEPHAAEEDSEEPSAPEAEEPPANDDEDVVHTPALSRAQSKLSVHSTLAAPAGSRRGSNASQASLAVPSRSASRMSQKSNASPSRAATRASNVDHEDVASHVSEVGSRVATPDPELTEDDAGGGRDSGAEIGDDGPLDADEEGASDEKAEDDPDEGIDEGAALEVMVPE